MEGASEGKCSPAGAHALVHTLWCDAHSTLNPPALLSGRPVSSHPSCLCSLPGRSSVCSRWVTFTVPLAAGTPCVSVLVPHRHSDAALSSILPRGLSPLFLLLPLPADAWPAHLPMALITPDSAFSFSPVSTWSSGPTGAITRLSRALCFWFLCSGSRLCHLPPPFGF